MQCEGQEEVVNAEINIRPYKAKKKISAMKCQDLQ